MAARLVFHIVKKKFEGELAKDRTALVDCVESVRFEGEDATYIIPDVYQPVDFHETLKSNGTIGTLLKNPRRTFSKEGQYRDVKITMTEAMKKAYLDDAENFIFKDCVLEAYEEPTEEVQWQETHENKKSTKENSMELLRKIESSFAISKFDKMSQNAEDWLQDFELECSHFDIKSDEMKIRALKYFVKDISEDWYKACLTQFSIKDMAPWKTSFLSAFGERVTSFTLSGP